MLNIEYFLVTGVFVGGFLALSSLLVRALSGASEIEAIHMALPF